MKDIITIFSVLGIITICHVAARLMGYLVVWITGDAPIMSLHDLTVYLSIIVIYFDIKKDAVQ